ncbi:protein ALP1-like [Senna tora]|uniref:Protein ALP1-like n=1 Tax=Senna tora TaxID=362788 RepID=A0A834SYJ2_9FABA|nr:protein ALP1-like [Senna tora]
MEESLLSFLELYVDEEAVCPSLISVLKWSGSFPSGCFSYEGVVVSVVSGHACGDYPKFRSRCNVVGVVENHCGFEQPFFLSVLRDYCDRLGKNTGCLSALDGTHIRIRVLLEDQPRYRNRKVEITTNVLGEGSAGDSRVLRYSILKLNGLKVPEGQYYLVDAGFTNGLGFLAPYRGQRYHLSEWREKRLPILRNPSFYPVRTNNRVILACCLLHNLIREDSALDPLENQVCEDTQPVDGETIGTTETSNAWTAFRDRTAVAMFNDFRGQETTLNIGKTLTEPTPNASSPLTSSQFFRASATSSSPSIGYLHCNEETTSKVKDRHHRNLEEYFSSTVEAEKTTSIHRSRERQRTR